MMASHNAGSDFVWKLVNHCQPTSTVDGDLLSWLPNSKLKPIHKSLEIKYPSQIDIYISSSVSTLPQTECQILSFSSDF